jgi:CubicO group peptidase (beta-lactamase class C family)
MPRRGRALACRCGVIVVAVGLLGGPALGRASHVAGWEASEASDVAAAAARLPRLRSLVVSWRSTIVFERYFHGATATRLANMKSASKSIISALVGIAIDKGAIPSAAEPIGSYFPDLLADDPESPKRRIAIEDLLTMQSGLQTTSSRNYGAWVRSRNWVRYILERPLVSPPGTQMTYSTGNTHLLSAILTKATGVDTWAFANEALAKPLGFTLAKWPRDPQGIYFGGNDMLMTPRQMIAFGELYLRGGRVADRQVVPARWIEASFVPRARSPRSGQLYGLGWWIREIHGRPAYYAWGYGGQYIFVVPDAELVIVATSSSTVAEERRDHRMSLQDLIEQLVARRFAAHASATRGNRPVLSH